MLRTGNLEFDRWGGLLLSLVNGSFNSCSTSLARSLVGVEDMLSSMLNAPVQSLMGPIVEEISPISRVEWSQYNNRMLRCATRQGDVTKLERMEDLSKKDLSEASLLELAVICGQVSVLAFLHRKGIELKSNPISTNSILREATRNGDIPILKALRTMGLTYCNVGESVTISPSALDIARQDKSDDLLHLFHKWKIEDAASSREFVDSCAACLNKLLLISEDKKAAASLIAITDCNHNYHNSCLEQWLTKARTCPVCDEPIKGYAEVKIVEGTSEETALEIIGSYIRR